MFLKIPSSKSYQNDIWSKHYETALKSPQVWQYWSSWSEKFVRRSRSYDEQIFWERWPRLANPARLGVRFHNVCSICKRGAGFTLIETLIYIVLFTIVIGGGMVATYQVIQATDASYNHVILQEEANFLLRKIDWALTGATSIVTANSYTLSIYKPIFGVSTLLTFDLDIATNKLSLQEGANPAITLNASSVSVSLTPPSTPLFKKISVSDKPDALETNITLTTVQNGRNASQNFSITKYLRK